MNATRTLSLSDTAPNAKAERSRPAALTGLVLLLIATGAALGVFAGPPDPERLPLPSSWRELDVLARSPNPPLNGAVEVAIVAAWLVWAWAMASVAIEFALALAEAGPNRGAGWLRSARAIADRSTLPLARRAVAAAVLVQVATRPALPALALVQNESTAIVERADAPVAAPGVRFAGHMAQSEPGASPRSAVLKHVVRRGESPWSIADRYYGAGEEFDRLIDSNVGKRMPDGRIFDRAGPIYPGWVIDVPLPSVVIEEHDGTRWYVVQPGDTLRGIAAQVLGDEEGFQELFDMNVGARLGETGLLLQDPNRIWPGLRLRLSPEPFAAERVEEQRQPVEADTPAQTPAAQPVPLELTVPPPSPVGGDDNIASTPTPPLPSPSPGPIQVTSPTREPLAAAPTSTVLPAAAIVTAGLAAGLAGARVVVKRRRGPASTNHHTTEPEVRIEDGFATADPARELALRMAGGGGGAAQIASRLSRAYAAVLWAALTESERAQVRGKVELVAIRHGQESTTFVLQAPPAARPLLLRHVEAAAERAFGDDVDVEALVSHDGDVLIRLSRISHKRSLLELVEADHSDREELWPSPLLLPLGLLFDRQTLMANCRALSHVLVAAPVNQDGHVVLVALAASLAARCSPLHLGLVTFAEPRTLPDEVSSLPHQLIPVVDPADRDAVRNALEQLRVELDRRVAEPNPANPDVVLLINELGSVRKDEWRMLAPILTAGPRHGMHVVAASGRRVPELLEACPSLGELGTRLVLQVADEDASVALLGTPGAEELGPGGNLLLRLEQRTPVGAHGFRVAPDHLARLALLIRDAADREGRRPPERGSAPPVATVERTSEADTDSNDLIPVPEAEDDSRGTEEADTDLEPDGTADPLACDLTPQGR